MTSLKCIDTKETVPPVKKVIAYCLLTLICVSIIGCNSAKKTKASRQTIPTFTAPPVDIVSVGWSAFTNAQYICHSSDTSCPPNSSYAMAGMGTSIPEYAYQSYVLCITASDSDYDVSNTGAPYAELDASTKATIMNRMTSCCSSQNGLWHHEGAHYHDSGPSTRSLDQLKVGEAIANLVNRELYNYRCNE